MCGQFAGVLHGYVAVYKHCAVAMVDVVLSGLPDTATRRTQLCASAFVAECSAWQLTPEQVPLPVEGEQ
jgi:hypothetical protein